MNKIFFNIIIIVISKVLTAGEASNAGDIDSSQTKQFTSSRKEAQTFKCQIDYNNLSKFVPLLKKIVL